MNATALTALAIAVLSGTMLPFSSAEVDGAFRRESTAADLGIEISQQTCGPESCEIALRPVASLTAPPGGEKLPDTRVVVARDEQGRLMTINPARDRILVFDRDGRYQTTVGRRGRGSGEFQRIGDIHDLRGRGLALFDTIQRTLTVLNPDLTFGERVASSYRPVIFRDDGSYVIAEQIRTADLIGYPLHLVDRVGKVIRSFGVDTADFRSDLTRLTARRIGVARAGGIWAAAPGRYVLERWDPDTGARRAILRVKSSWFRESTRPPGPKEKPTPIIEAIWERGGYVWALLQDADRRWKPPPVSALELPSDPRMYNQEYDWVIEAVDPVTGDVVATKRYDEVLWHGSQDSILTTVTLGRASEVNQIQLWTAELRRKMKEVR